jgi:DNA-binding CsgD family transcriptional regulator
LDRLVETIGRISEFGDLDSFRAGIGPEIRRLVACDIASYNEIHSATGEAFSLLDPGDAFTNAATEAFGRFMGQNPLVAYEQINNDGRAVKFSDFISRRELHRLELYEFVYRELETEYQMAIALPASNGAIIGLALNRTKRDFSESDRELLDLLRPHAAAAHRRLTERAQILRALTEHEHKGRSGVLLLEGESLSYATDGAIALIPDLAAGRLPTVVRGWALDPLARRTDLTLHSAWGRLTAHFVPHHEADRKDAILLQLGPASTEGLDEAPELTERQAEILELVALGMSNQQIANATSLSPRTVEKHLERIYRQLGVSSRTEAVAYVKSRH